MENEAEANFAKWQQEVGHGRHTDDSVIISLPNYFHCRENTVDSLIETIDDDIERSNQPPARFAECTILSSLNANMDSIYKRVLEKFSGQSYTFHSTDYIPSSEKSGEDNPLLNYPVEYLNQINCSGFPLVKFEVKKGCPIMILKNLDPRHGDAMAAEGS
jgi:hypothetical protein